MVPFEMLLQAENSLNTVVRKTPILTSPFLDEIAGRKIFIKAECLQHTGSFKFRGAYNAISRLVDADKSKGVIAYSSGNHGQAVALVAKTFGLKSVIVMPSDAPLIKISNVKAYGSKVVLYDKTHENRESIGRRLSESEDLSLIKPFDNEGVIAGAGTVGIEIASQMKEIGITKSDVLVCCGGGGLASGIAVALRERATGFKVRTCEPEKFDDAARSLISGERLTNTEGEVSICDALLSPSLGEVTYPILAELAGKGLIVSDEEVLFSMAQAFLRLKIVLEPGGAVALAAALFRREEINNESIVVVATGGNVEPNLFKQSFDSLDA